MSQILFEKEKICMLNFVTTNVEYFNKTSIFIALVLDWSSYVSHD